MVLYEQDDLIGLGDFAATMAKVRKGARKFGKFLKRMKGKAAGRSVTVKGKTYSVDQSGAVNVSPAASQVEVVSPAGAGMMDFVKRNPLIVGVGALAVVALLMRRK